MVISKTSQSGTVTSGALTVNTGMPIMGLCREFIVEPVTGTATYTIELINDNSETVYKRESETGSLVELLSLPLLGVYTFKISAATEDGTYSFRLMIEE